MITTVIPFIRLTNHLRDSIRVLESSSLICEILLVDNNPKPVSIPFTLNKKVSVVRSDFKRNRSHARNLGAKMSKGDVLLFMDQDIRIEEDFLDRIELEDFKKFDVVLPKIIPTQIKTKLYYETYKKVSRGSFCIFSRMDLSLPSFDSACFLVRKSFFLKTPMFNEHFKRYEDRHWGTHAVLSRGRFLCKENLSCSKDVEDKSSLSFLVSRWQELAYRRLSNSYFFDGNELFPVPFRKNFAQAFLAKVAKRITSREANRCSRLDESLVVNIGNQSFSLASSFSYVCANKKIKILNVMNYKFCVLTGEAALAALDFFESGKSNKEALCQALVAKNLVSIGLMSKQGCV